MLCSSPNPGTYGALPFHRAISNANSEEYFYIGNRSPTAEELRNCLKELFSSNAHSISDLRINGCGYSNVNVMLDSYNDANAPRAPKAAPGTQNQNSVYILFASTKDLKAFSERIISPSMHGISLHLKISSPRLI